MQVLHFETLSSENKRIAAYIEIEIFKMWRHLWLQDFLCTALQWGIILLFKGPLQPSQNKTCLKIKLYEVPGIVLISMCHLFISGFVFKSWFSHSFSNVNYF